MKLSQRTQHASPVGQTDIVGDRCDVTARQGLADHGFGVIAESCRLFDTGAGVSPQVKFEHAAIDLRKESAAERKYQQQRKGRIRWGAFWCGASA